MGRVSSLIVRAGLPLAALLLPSCALTDLLCPPAGEVTDFSLVTPAATFHSFQRALRAGNEVYEYRCLSNRLKERLEIDLQKYVLGRRHFLRKNRREVEAFKEATIRDIRLGRTYEFPGGPYEIAEVILSAGELAEGFLLINEPYWEVSLARGLEEPDADWGDVADLASRITVDGRELRIRVPLEQGQEFDPASIAGFEMKNEWKVLDFLGMREYAFDPETSGDPDSTGP
jgi:hypothetical protein